MNNEVFIKKNGVVSISNSSRLLESKIQDKDCHLCARCANGYPSKCEKILDVHKKAIIDYDYVIDGIQTFDNNGDSDNFIVEKCENYIPVLETTRNNKGKLAYYKKLKGDIAAGYFETPTREEAYLLQAELFERGHLKFDQDKLPSEKTLDIMRKRIGK